MYSLLIVEDEYLVRQGIRSLVDFSQFKIDRVNEAENGQLAWDLFQKEPYDIVLTDINMPKLNGIQLAELIKQESPKLIWYFWRATMILTMPYLLWS